MYKSIALMLLFSSLSRVCFIVLMVPRTSTIVKYSHIVLSVRQGTSPSFALRVQSQGRQGKRVLNVFRPCSSGPRSHRVSCLLVQSFAIKRGGVDSDSIGRARVEIRVLVRVFESRYARRSWSRVSLS